MLITIVLLVNDRNWDVNNLPIVLLRSIYDRNWDVINLQHRKKCSLIPINDFKPWMKKILLFQIQRYAKPIIVYSNFTFENNLKHMNESMN